MIRAGIETEIAPIVGTEQQAEDLIKYIKESPDRGESIWETNIFGKTVEMTTWNMICLFRIRHISGLKILKV